MRPMLPFFGFPTYHLSKYLTTVLQPLTDKSRRKLKSTENFIDDYKLVSFDTKSLFPGIPLRLALQSTKSAIKQSIVKLPLPTEDIMELLNPWLGLTFRTTYGKHYKQLHVTVMESSVSLVTRVSNLPTNATLTGDTFTSAHKDEIDAFHEHLN